MKISEMGKTLLVAKICYFLQLHRLGYFLNRSRKRIITFHNVLPDDLYADTLANGVSCSMSDFRTIISEIGRRYPFSLDLEDPTTATITFDDGYFNQAATAADYLIEKKMPAYLFVCGKLLKHSILLPPPTSFVSQFPQALTIDKLLHWISYVPSGEYDVCDQHICIATDNRDAIWSDIIWPSYLKDANAKGDNVLASLDAAYPVKKIFEHLSPQYVCQRLQGVSQTQLDKLVDNGWQIGWHTFSHFPLGYLDKEGQEYELTPMHPCDCTVMSFPYGGPADVDSDTFAIAARHGFTCGVSNVNDCAANHSKWYKPRMSLSANKYLLHFELSGLKYLMKNFKLLPK